MTELAKQTGIRREQLYQALSENGNPTLQTLMPVLAALGVSLDVKGVKPTQDSVLSLDARFTQRGLPRCVSAILSKEPIGRLALPIRFSSLS